MIVEKNLILRSQIFDNIRKTVTEDREGIHLSDLIYCSRKAYWRMKGMAPSATDKQCLLWTTGYAFQHWLFPAEIEVPIQVDGIWCSPDISSGIEVKSTRQSSGNFDFDSMLHWKRQILGYCKALNKLEYDLVVMFVCGNYKPPFPNLDCWHIVATQEEVDENWLWICSKALILTHALLTNTPPEPDNEPWECKMCEAINLCSDVFGAQQALGIKKLKRKLDK